MQRRRLVVRRRSGLDRRALSLTLTEKGLELVEQIAPIAQFYENVAMEGLSTDEIKQLKHLLRKIFESLDHAGRAKAAVIKAEKKARPRKAGTRAPVSTNPDRA